MKFILRYLWELFTYEQFISYIMCVVVNNEKLHHINKDKCKGCGVMRYVLQQVHRRDTEQLLSVVKMEIDYELVSLYDSLQTDDTEGIERAKNNLKDLVKRLEILSRHVD